MLAPEEIAPYGDSYSSCQVQGNGTSMVTQKMSPFGDLLMTWSRPDQNIEVYIAFEPWIAVQNDICSVEQPRADLLQLTFGVDLKSGQCEPAKHLQLGRLDVLVVSISMHLFCNCWMAQLCACCVVC